MLLFFIAPGEVIVFFLKKIKLNDHIEGLRRSNFFIIIICLQQVGLFKILGIPQNKQIDNFTT